MAINYDAYSETSLTSGNPASVSWTHTPVGTPKAIVVYVVHHAIGSFTDQVTGVTYGGVAMSEATASPSIQTAGDEDSVVYCYFLGAGIPTGAQSVVVSLSIAANEDIRFYAVSYTAAGDTEMVASEALVSTGADPSDTLALGGATAAVLMGWFSGQGAVTSITELSGWTSRIENDEGVRCNGIYTYNTVGSSDVTYGATVAAEDWNSIGLAFKESSAGLTASPGRGSLTLTGYAPTLVLPLNITPGSGTLTLTGHAPTVDLALMAEPGVGTLTLTGFAPEVSIAAGDALTASPGTGTLTLTGFAPTIDLPLDITPGAGTLTLTGFAPNVTTELNVAPGVGSLTLTGFAPTVTVSSDIFVSPGTGQLILTGYAPTVEGGEATVVSGGQQPAGRPSKDRKPSRRKRRPVIVTVDGEDFVVSSEHEAEQLVKAAKEAAEQKSRAEAEEVVRKRRAKAKQSGRLNTTPITISEPEIAVAGTDDGRPTDPNWINWVQERVESEVKAAYEASRRAAELQILLAAQKQLELDEEDALVALLFTI